MNLIGIDFSSKSIPLDTEKLGLNEFQSNDLFYALSGALHHALLEWSAVCIAVIATIFSFVHYRVKRDITVPIIGIALLCAGLVDAFHTLASMRIIRTDTFNVDFIPFTWALSRSFNAFIMICGVLIGFWVANQMKAKSTRLGFKQPKIILAVVSIVFFCGSCAAILLASTSDDLPQTMFAEAVIKRPYDVLALSLFLLVGMLFWFLYSRKKSPLPFALLLSIVPEVTTQLHMVFGSKELFDNHFNIAHGLKIIAYGLILLGFLYDYIDELRAQSIDGGKLNQTLEVRTTGIQIELDNLLEIRKPQRPLGIFMPMVTFILTLVVSLAVSFTYYIEDKYRIVQEEIKVLDSHSAFIQPLLRSAFEQVHQDVIFLSRTPPVQGIIEAKEQNNQEQFELWKDRLSILFSNLQQPKQDYLQIRYLGIENMGRELVRTDKKSFGVVVVPDSMLQKKGESNYMVRTLRLNRGDVFFSKIELNREDGQIAIPHMPVIRVATPIFDSAGNAFGIIIINLDFGALVRELRNVLPDDAIFYFANQEGDYLIHSDKNKTFGFDIGTRFRMQDDFPRALELLKTKENKVVFKRFSNNQEEKFVAQYNRLILNDLGFARRLNILMLFDESLHLLNAYNSRNRALILSISLSFLILTLAIFVTRKLLKPLKSLTASLDEYADTGVVGNLPVESKDEIGTLARAFHSLLYLQKIRVKELADARKYIDGISDNVPQLLSYIDKELRYRSANKAYEEWFGIPSEKFVGNLIQYKLGEDAYQNCLPYVNAALSGTSVSFGSEILCKEGRLKYVRVSYVPDFDENGVALGFFVSIEDITSLKLSEKRLTQAFAKLDQQKFALDQHAIVATTDIKGTITHINDKFCEISGYSPNELLGQNHRILNSGYHDKEFFRNMYLTISKGNIWHEEICNRAKDGHEYWVDTTIVPFLNEQKKPESYIAIRADITQRKVYEQELIDAKTFAEDADKIKSEFLASMSHEIRTPMNGVLGMLGILNKSELNDNQKRQVEIARNSATSLLSIINDILDFSKVDAGKLELEEITFNLRQLLDDVSEAQGLKAYEKQLEFVVDARQVDALMVTGDPGRIRQILNNLIGNAIKFTDKGEIVLRAVLTAQDGFEEATELNLDIVVSDTGIGISKDKLSTLFDAFTQADSSTTRKYGGTGLGLSITKRLCELMGGSISVESDYENGSRFKFNIKLKPCSKFSPVLPKVDISQLKILVVDDNATNREVLQGQLSLWGASLLEAEDAFSALALLEKDKLRDKSERLDLAIIDMQMPGMNGADLGERIRNDKEFSYLKLVMMTSMAHRGDAKFFAEKGFQVYFPKPVTTDDLFKALSVVSTGGEALEYAEPLITSHYLRAINHNENFDSSKKTIFLKDTRILLVEDNIVNQEVAKDLLEEGMGISVVIAGNGIEAIDLLRDMESEAPFHVVLMDCQMPEMDGYEATRAIREGVSGIENNSIPIIAMTANAMKGDRDKCLEAGMDDYISKPVDSDELTRIMKKWLSSDRLSQKLKRQDSQSYEVNNSLVDRKTDNNIWDKNALLKRVRGKLERMQKLIGMFVDTAEQRINMLTQAIEKENFNEIENHAHSLKGSSGNLGALQFFALVGEIEFAAKKKDIKKCNLLIESLQPYYNALTKEFDRYFL